MLKKRIPFLKPTFPLYKQYVGAFVYNTLIFELYNSSKPNRDTYSKPPWALRVPMKAEDRYPYVLFSLISRAQILCLLFQMRQHII